MTPLTTEQLFWALWRSRCQAGIGLIRPIPDYQKRLLSVAHGAAGPRGGPREAWISPERWRQAAFWHLPGKPRSAQCSRTAVPGTQQPSLCSGGPRLASASQSAAIYSMFREREHDIFWEGQVN